MHKSAQAFLNHWPGNFFLPNKRSLLQLHRCGNDGNEFSLILICNNKTLFGHPVLIQLTALPFCKSWPKSAF